VRSLRGTSSCGRVSALTERSGAVTAKMISPARWAAFKILERVNTTDEHSDDLLHSSLMETLSQADKNLTTALVLGVLRWQIALDAVMIPMIERPDEVVSPVATALRLGAFQLLHMDRIPAHAALNESVELTRAARHGHAAGMVNAVLRKIQRAPKPKVPVFETTAVFSERLSHPEWMVQRWVKSFGRADAMTICEFDQREPAGGGLFVDEALPMDDGSRLVAELAAASADAPKRIWDCCAAPGNKTRVLALRHPEAELLATDRSARRLKIMRQRLQLPDVKMLECDAAALPEDEGAFDLILCDVPCSGPGPLARNPELKMRLEPTEPARQSAEQTKILTAALQRLAPGGRLLYSTCSLEPAENGAVVEAALAKTTGVAEVSLEASVAKLVASGRVSQTVPLRDGRLRTLPGVGLQCDGFFAVLLERTR
jgi:16S rRNA (cytosine967-C5)-methyltransferase